MERITEAQATTLSGETETAPSSSPLKVLSDHLQDFVENPSALEVFVTNYTPSAWYEQPLLIPSGLALILSIYSIFHSSRSAKIARNQSVQDEFWIRTVLYPKAVEPIIDFINEFDSLLPNETKLESDQARSYVEQFSLVNRRLMLKISIARAIDANLFRSIIMRLEELEDETLSFIAALEEKREYNNNQEVHNQRREIASKSEQIIVDILELIKEQQKKLK